MTAFLAEQPFEVVAPRITSKVLWRASIVALAVESQQLPFRPVPVGSASPLAEPASNMRVLHSATGSERLRTWAVERQEA